MSILLLWKRPAVTVTTLLAAILLVALLVYWPGLSGPFVLDDVPNITVVYIENPDLDGVIYSITHNGSGMFGRSVSMLSFVLTGLAYGLEPWGYKFHNLLLHLCNGLLLFRLAWVLLPEFGPGLEQRRRLLIAGSLSAAWLLHPLQVSTVLYIVQRMTELAAFFSLAALLAYVEARKQPGGLRFILLAWLTFPLCLALALLSKETGALIPLYVLVIELLAFRDMNAWRQRRLLSFLLVFAVLPLVAGSLYMLTHLDRFTDYSMRSFTLLERLLTQLHVVGQYVRMILLPRLRDMSLYHDDFPVTQALDPTTLVLLAGLAATCAAIWLCRRRAPVIAFGLAWFLASHVLESTVLPLELMFEHRNYLAVAGLLLPPLYYLGTAADARAFQLVAGVFIVLLAFQTSNRVLEWSDEELLLSVAVEDHPRSGRARTFLANHRYARGRVDEALQHLAISEEVSPSDAGASIHYVGLQCLEGVRDESALERARQRLRQYPVTVYGLNGLENILNWRGADECQVLTAADIENLIDIAMAQPGNAANKINSGYLLRLRGVVNFNQREYAQGVIDFRVAYDMTGMPEIIAELVRYQARLQRFDDAEETLAFLRELNAADLGIHTLLVEKHAAVLAQARADAANPTPAVPVPGEPAASESSATR